MLYNTYVSSYKIYQIFPKVWVLSKDPFTYSYGLNEDHKLKLPEVIEARKEHCYKGRGERFTLRQGRHWGF